MARRLPLPSWSHRSRQVEERLTLRSAHHDQDLAICNTRGVPGAPPMAISFLTKGRQGRAFLS